ncbi:MAG: hypothetical protein QOI61_2088 [Actinomycetota bacterium]|jgi:hypothetical protein
MEPSNMVDSQDGSYIVHLVTLDEHFPSSFRTTSRDKAEAALRLLADAFGPDRVSMTSFGESDLDEYRDVVAMWAADPRLREPRG